jgi:uncharacterized protein (DUF362 family)
MRNYIYYQDYAEYPSDKYFRPDKEYPEYPFSMLGISKQKNDVYEMIRNMFINLFLDEKNIGSDKWNPLGEYISPNDVVLIKPNWVKHENEAIKGKEGMECMITNTSIIRCVIDYVLIALKGSGKLIIADAPVQSCDFGQLKKKSGLYNLESFYRKANVNIQFVDLRNYRSRKINGNVVTVPISSEYKGKIINLGKHSYFFKNCKEGKLRITNYDYREVNKHHNGNTHEYCISQACLAADVIINLPKPKTHRKAGYTGALKNMIGINAMKDYLPHHTKGSYILNEGDEYYSDSKIAKKRSDINDIVDVLEKKSLFGISRILKKKINSLADNSNTEKYSEGSWWGNDTLWKTILDLNTIVLYADKEGRLKNTRQRKVITIGDMIVSGEKEGPIAPSPKKTNSIIFSDNSILFDEILTRFMGLEVDKLILLKMARRNKKFVDCKIDECDIFSNSRKFGGKIIGFKSGYRFEPSQGWKGYI